VGEDLIVVPIRVCRRQFSNERHHPDGIELTSLSEVWWFANKRHVGQPTALLQLGMPNPHLFVLTDIAWQMLFKAQPGAEIAAVQEVIGSGVPIAGGYTLGQIVPGANGGLPRFLNQHLMVIVFGATGG
jgi:hypothetical protein